MASDRFKILAGVPQGSVLGHILLIIFINDIVHVNEIGSCICLFADDTSPFIIVGYPVSSAECPNADLVKILKMVKPGW